MISKRAFDQEDADRVVEERLREGYTQIPNYLLQDLISSLDHLTTYLRQKRAEDSP